MGSMQLPPGFRFHPTDEELVGYYLKRKVEGLKIELEVIPVIDLYKFDPWELPDKSFLPKRDMEWFFFCPRDRKYPNGSRTNRATGSGYWKATGKDRKIVSHSAVTGFRKTLVFYRGRAPLGDRTDWVMHEYRLFEDVSQGSSGFWGAFALCRVVKKNDQGQKVGNQQGEPKIRRGVSSNMNDSRSACEFANSSEKNPSQANNQVNEETTSGIRTSLELERAVADTDQTCLWESHDQQSNASKDFREAGEINSSWVPGNGFPKSNLPWQLCDPMELQSPPYSKFIHEVDPGENHSPMRFELPYLSPINCTGLCSDMDTVFQSFDRLHSFDLSNVSTAITGFEPMNSMMPPSICRETSGDGNFVEVSNLWGTTTSRLPLCEGSRKPISTEDVM